MTNNHCKIVILILFALIFLVLSSVLFVLLFAFQNVKPHTPCQNEWGPVTYYHRGNLTFAQENTFTAIVNGSAANGNNPELDVSLLKDGEGVLFHDDSMLRMTGVDKDIRDVSIEEVLGTPILQEIDGYSYNFTNSIPEIEPVIEAICNVDANVGMNIDVKVDANGAAKAVVSALKSSTCAGDETRMNNIIFSTPYPNIVSDSIKELKAAGLNNRVAIYMPSGYYGFLGLKVMLKTRILQSAMFGGGASIIEVEKIVYDAEQDLLQKWRDDGWCIGVWGLKPNDVSEYDVDVYIVDDAPAFPDLVAAGGRLGGDGIMKKVTYDDNSLTPYNGLIAAATFCLLFGIILIVLAVWLEMRYRQSKQDISNAQGDSVDDVEGGTDIMATPY